MQQKAHIDVVNRKKAKQPKIEKERPLGRKIYTKHNSVILLHLKQQQQQQQQLVLLLFAAGVFVYLWRWLCCEGPKV